MSFYRPNEIWQASDGSWSAIVYETECLNNDWSADSEHDCEWDDIDTGKIESLWEGLGSSCKAIGAIQEKYGNLGSYEIWRNNLEGNCSARLDALVEEYKAKVTA